MRKFEYLTRELISYKRVRGLLRQDYWTAALFFRINFDMVTLGYHGHNYAPTLTQSSVRAFGNSVFVVFLFGFLLRIPLPPLLFCSHFSYPDVADDLACVFRFARKAQCTGFWCHTVLRRFFFLHAAKKICERFFSFVVVLSAHGRHFLRV